MRKLFSIFVILFLTGCAHKVKLENMNYSLAHLRKGLTSILPGGIRSWSQNQRTLTSSYFPPEDPKTKNLSKLQLAETAPLRSVVNVVLLGSRRPYVVEFEVLIEVKDHRTGVYRLVRKDNRLAKVFANELQEYLVKSQESRDLIDDFRPF